MSSYNQVLYQIIFSTKRREKTLIKPQRDQLYGYIGGILKNKRCKPYIINGIEDHLHILVDIHPTIAIASLVKDIKISCSSMIKKNNLFPGFTNWALGYSAFTYSVNARDNLFEYIKGQEEHHKTETFEEEFRRLLDEHGVDYDPKYLFKD